jgi:hypothetical protein
VPIFPTQWPILARLGEVTQVWARQGECPAALSRAPAQVSSGDMTASADSAMSNGEPGRPSPKSGMAGKRNTSYDDVLASY